MITAAGLLLWALIALLLCAVLRLAALPGPRSWRGRIGLVLLAAGLALLLFRPDEEIAAGEDAGAYFNAALSFARSQSLFALDPGLALLPAESRPTFRYGHAGFLHTKDAVLWAPEADLARVGPHFFPGYSILLGVAAAVGAPYLMFMLSALLSLGIGLLLAVLARWLTGRNLAGWIALGLFLLHPAVIWNARCLRAEWPAALLALGAMTLWMAHVVMGLRVSRSPALLAGLSLAVACGVHITSVYVLLPAMAASLWHTRRQSFWFFWWGGLLLGGALWLAQIVWITDPYWLQAQWAEPARRAGVIAAAMAGGLCLWAVRLLWRRLFATRSLPRETSSRVTGSLGAAAMVALILVVMRLGNEQGLIPGLPAWTAAYVSLTDFAGVMRTMSRAAFAASLAGLLCLGAGAGPRGRLGRWILFWLAPASMTIGWVFNFMFETRRMVGFLVPLLVLAATVLLFKLGEWTAAAKRWLETTLPAAAPWRRLSNEALALGLPCLLCSLLLVAAVRGRSHLYTTWNNRGSYRFYRQLAADLRQSGDFLFAEYTQTAAPLERLSGLPLLPLAWGYRDETEYRAAERVFERLVREHPHRRHLLVTPFAGAALPGLSLQPLERRKLSTMRLARARRTIPLEVNPYKLTLHVHQVELPEPTLQPRPYSRPFDGGRLGLEGAANFMPGRAIAIEGMALAARRRVRLPMPLPETATAGRLLLIFHHGAEIPPGSLALQAHPGNQLDSVRWFTPASGWIGADLAMELLNPGELMLSMESELDLLLTDMFWQDGENGSVLRLQAQETASKIIDNVDSQWLRARSAVALPSLRGGGDLWIMATHGRPGRETVGISLQHREDARVEASLAPGWRWLWLPLAPTLAPSGFLWHDLAVDPPWDPELGNFPDDLGMRVHVMTQVPHDA